MGFIMDVFSPIVRSEVVDLIRILHPLERILYDIRHLYVRVGDEGVEIYPPDPVPLPSLNQSFHHVELPVCGSPIGMRFIVNNKMVAMAARVVCPWSMAEQVYGPSLVYLRSLFCSER